MTTSLVLLCDHVTRTITSHITCFNVAMAWGHCYHYYSKSIRSWNTYSILCRWADPTSDHQLLWAWTAFAACPRRDSHDNRRVPDAVREQCSVRHAQGSPGWTGQNTYEEPGHYICSVCRGKVTKLLHPLASNRRQWCSLSLPSSKTGHRFCCSFFFFFEAQRQHRQHCWGELRHLLPNLMHWLPSARARGQ